MDLHWLAAEARDIHQIFLGSFYWLVTTLLLVGVVLEFLKIPLGQGSSPLVLVGRALVASLILAFVPDFMNTLGLITDSVCRELGGLNEIKFVLSRMGDKVGELTWSWISVKDSILLLISFGSFFLLYVTVYIMNAYFLFTWMLLYIFSPILCALYVLPQTESGTKKLFKSMIEVCLWKIMWGVLGSLLWSMALSDINQESQQVDFLTAIILNLMLAFSILLTPMIVGSFLRGGVSQVATGLGNVIMGAAALTPTGLALKSKAAMAKGLHQFKPETTHQTQDGHPPAARKWLRKPVFQRKGKL